MATIEGRQPVNYEHLRHVEEVENTGEANKLLDEGWALLSVQQTPYGQPVYILGREAGRRIKVQWADDAVERCLRQMTDWRDGNGTVEAHDQAVLVAIDCLRTVLGKDDN